MVNLELLQWSQQGIAVSESRAALVTGVGRRAGIGPELCRRLIDDGFRVCYSFWQPYDRDAPWAWEEGFSFAFEEELRSNAATAHALEIDLSLPESPASLFRQATERVGEISVLINNAAVSEMGGIDEIDGPMLDRHYAVNVRGMVLLTSEFVRQFNAGFGGRVINMTSGQGLGPMPEELAYAASKGAVEAFTTSLSPAVASRGITVNAVNPGPTDTGWISDDLREILLAQLPIGRIGTPADVANLVAFLISEEGGWVTGQVINSEGGFWRK